MSFILEVRKRVKELKGRVLELVVDLRFIFGFFGERVSEGNFGENVYLV